MKKTYSLIFIFVCVAILFTGCDIVEDLLSSILDSETPAVQTTQISVPSLSKMYVASDGLNVRNRPSAEGTLVKTLKRNDTVFTDKENHNGWYEVHLTSTGDALGYVNAKYLSATVTEATKAAATAAPKAETATTAPAAAPATTAPAATATTKTETKEPAKSEPVAETPAAAEPEPATQTQPQSQNGTLTKRKK